MRFLTITFISLTSFISGCSLTTKELQNGYLDNYHNLTTLEDSSQGYHQRWLSRDMTRRIAPFEPSAAYLAPIVFYPQLTAHEQFDVAAANRLKQYLDLRLYETVSQYFAISNVKQQGVLVIEPAITAVKISLEDLSPLEVIPFRAVISAKNLSIDGRDRDVEIRLETKLSNGRNDKLLATSVQGGQGLQLENSSEKLSQAHVEQLIDNWVAQWHLQLKAYKRKLDANS